MTTVLSERIAQARVRAGLTQSDLATAIGSQLRSFLNWESGARAPDIDTLIRISDALNVSVEWLLGRERPRELTRADLIEPSVSPRSLESPEMLRPADLAKLLGVDRILVRNLIRRGIIGAISLSPKVMVVPVTEAQAVLEYIAHKSKLTKRRDQWPCKSSPGGCVCHCHALTAGRARGKRVAANQWLPAHDARLLALLRAGDSPEVIAEKLSGEISIFRTAQAVRRRLTILGTPVSSRSGWWSRTEVSEKLGLGEKRLAALEAQGALPSQPYGRWRRYQNSQVRAVVEQFAGTLIDPRRVRDPQLRSLAETSAIVNQRRREA